MNHPDVSAVALVDLVDCGDGTFGTVVAISDEDCYARAYKVATGSPKDAGPLSGTTRPEKALGADIETLPASAIPPTYGTYAGGAKIHLLDQVRVNVEQTVSIIAAISESPFVDRSRARDSRIAGLSCFVPDTGRRFRSLSAAGAIE